MKRRRIESDWAPAAIGPYSQAIMHGDVVFCSGQIGLERAGAKMVAGGVEAQTRRALENLRAVLGQAGMSLDSVVKTTIFLTDLGDFDVVNSVYSEYFNPPYPARSTVQAAALPRGARVEIEAIAMRDDGPA
jgi:2-iminobutanoate/2-iminopropanoate deaminase